jgi:glucosylceramidase
VTPSGQYRALAHFSKFIKPGSTILATRSTGKVVQHVAARTPDGKTILVLTNPGPTRTVPIRVGRDVTTVTLPAGSVATLTW